ncbi:hypothetical protein Q1695_008863 [Nippostrongylus brasiliensis]|nr:hypothetical protein Q1695_008863 [Nippostrongylus brasiliensis]
MLQPQVTFLVTLWGALLRTTEAVNSSTLPSPRDDLAMDQVVESSVKLQHLEGSGMEPTMDSSSALTTLAHIDTLFGNKVKKRAADFYNGVLGPQFFSPFNIAAPRFPPNAVIGLSRPLQRGNVPPRVEYVALWNPRGGAPHWGTVYLDNRLQIEGSFVKDGRLMNLTQPSMSKEPIRLLQYIGTPESNNFNYVYLGREVNTTNDLSPELSRRKRAAWGAFKSVEEVARKTNNAQLHAHLFDSTDLPAMTYASESWALRKQDDHAICGAHRSVGRRVLGVTHFIQSSELRRQSKIRDAVAWAKLSKVRWGGHVMRFRDDRWTRAVTDWIPQDVRRTPGRPPLRWSDFFVKSLNGRFDPRARRASRTCW